MTDQQRWLHDMTDRPTARRVMAIAILLAAAMPSASAQEPAAQRPPAPDSALRAFIAEASALNSQVPERLGAYRATVETEISLSILDSAGFERTAQVEQVASEVRWRSNGQYEQRVVGYRSEAVAPTFSLMSIFGGWTTPTLYGNRLQLGVTSANAPQQQVGSGRGLAIHPLAQNRDRYYTITGGDTVAVLQSRDRRISVVSLQVTPRADVPGDAILFQGDVQLDAERKHIVRMRGRMVEYDDGKPTISAGSRIPGASGASYVELVNAELEGEFWLPAFQRTELQARLAFFGEFRTIVRIVSRFHDHRPNDSTWFAGAEAPPGVRHHLTFAPSASLSRYSGWQRPLGEASDDVRYADFDDLAPGQWQEEEPEAEIRFRPRTLAEVFRFNRIEGVFTGVAVERGLPELGDGYLLRATGGVAWSERTVRGALSAEHRGGDWTQGIRLERALASTNDFQSPLSWGATLAALLGSADNFDYVDRWSAIASVRRLFGASGRSSFRIEAGPARDRAVERNIARGLFVEGVGFRENRGIHEGDYLSSAAVLEISPQVTGMFVNRGLGARLRYERADGGLQWQRLELRVAARRPIGPFDLYGRADAGTLFGDAVPQALFEIGRFEGLSAHEYKEFGGDRAAVGRAILGYTLPILRAPIRLPNRLFIPGIAPGIAVGVHGGWAEASNESAWNALRDLGTYTDTTTGLEMPLSRPTDGIRASGEILLTFFNGGLSLGVARPLDRSGPWRFTGRLGQGF